MAKGEGILQVLNDVRLGCHIVRTFAVVNRVGDTIRVSQQILTELRLAVAVAAMARAIRIECGGAFYHVMARATGASTSFTMTLTGVFSLRR
jgi:hypothetical protein